jgi:transposase
MDEKPVQLLEDKRKTIQTSPSKEAKQDYEYKRKGTVNVYCIVEPKAGKHLVNVTPNRKKPEFAKTLKKISAKYPQAKKIHLVLDNLSGHSKNALTEAFGPKIGEKLWDRFKIHYTPKHGSWLNQAEIEISMFRRQCIGKDRIPDIHSLKQRAEAWTKRLTRKRQTIKWRFTTAKARKVFHYKRVTTLRPDD